jgi:hypothetical protein
MSTKKTCGMRMKEPSFARSRPDMEYWHAFESLAFHAAIPTEKALAPLCYVVESIIGE